MALKKYSNLYRYNFTRQIGSNTETKQTYTAYNREWTNQESWLLTLISYLVTEIFEKRVRVKSHQIPLLREYTSQESWLLTPYEERLSVKSHQIHDSYIPYRITWPLHWPDFLRAQEYVSKNFCFFASLVLLHGWTDFIFILWCFSLLWSKIFYCNTFKFSENFKVFLL